MMCPSATQRTKIEEDKRWINQISCSPLLMLTYGVSFSRLLLDLLTNIYPANSSPICTIKDYCRSRNKGYRCCWHGLVSLPQVWLQIFKISDTVTTIDNRLAIQFLLKLLTHYHRLVTIYSWMEQLAARFPHLVSLKVSNPWLYLGHWTKVHVGPSIWSFWCPWRSLILYFTWAIGPKCTLGRVYEASGVLEGL